MEKLAFTVERLNAAPFAMEIDNMAEFDSKSSLQLLAILTEVVITIDPDQASIKNEDPENKVHKIIKFLLIMKFSVPDDQIDDFTGLMMSGDKEVLHSVLHWCLQRFEQLQKRAYLAKYLLPMDIPSDFLGDDLVNELMANLKELQSNFKDVHKSVDQLRAEGSKPAQLRSEITHLEQEKTQLQNKIQKMKRESKEDEAYFQEMLKVTAALRKEQEDEAHNYDKMRELRATLLEADSRFSDASRRLADTKTSGVQNMSAEQLLTNLQKEVRELTGKRETFENAIFERQAHLDKLQSWDSDGRVITEDDVLNKREQVGECEDQLKSIRDRMEGALERNPKLAQFHQASTMAQKKLRDKEEEVEKFSEEKRRLKKLIEDKEEELRSAGKGANKLGRKDLKKYGAIVRDKIEVYKKMRDELAALRNELVIVQRTEQILRSRHKHIDEFNAEMERRKELEGENNRHRMENETGERAMYSDSKDMSLDQLSTLVDGIVRDCRAKQSQLQPLISDLKTVRQEFMTVEADYNDAKATYDKSAVSLEFEKQTLEKDCDSLQEECLREESRLHTINSLLSICRIKLERAEQEKRWQSGQGRLIRDFASFKELYANKLTQQEALTKQLRKRQKDLQENSSAMTNQKSNFKSLQTLMQAKIQSAQSAGNEMLGFDVMSRR